MSAWNTAVASVIGATLSVTSTAPAGAEEATATTVVITGKRTDGPGLSETGSSDYAVTDFEIGDIPTGNTAGLNDVLAQMPGVAIDQNQQIHIRNTEGPQFQYQINGVLVPLDINTNPPFLSMINPKFVNRLDLIDGVLPSRYAYATGGVIDIRTKDGCAQPGGGLSVTVGQRGTVAPTAQFGGCAGKFSFYINGQYNQGNTAFSQATPGAEPIHDQTRQGNGFGQLAYQFTPHTRLSVTLSASSSDNQLPNVPDLTPQFTLAGVTPENSSAIDSRLNFRDKLAIVALNGGDGGALAWQIAWAAHTITQEFRPDNAGELVYQGVASTATHTDHDQTLEGDISWHRGAHTLSAGFYAGRYLVNVADTTLAFPVDGDGNQAQTTPVSRTSTTHQPNLVLGLHLGDLWQISDTLKLDTGLRVDRLSGFTDHVQIDPTINLSYATSRDTVLHAGFARYMQVPVFQGVAPDAAALFSGTTAAASNGGTVNPLTEDDDYWDVGLTRRLNEHVRLSLDGYFELTHHYLDTGQFGVVPIFAPFNYGEGTIWGAELALRYHNGPLSAYANCTFGQNWQRGVATGQFNFDPDELAYIKAHHILLDHQPLAGVSAGVTWKHGDWSISADGLYSSGLRGGFADQRALPAVVQANASVERSFALPGIGRITNRLAVINLTDRTNLIRPADGIGIYQAAYGPRLTVQDTLSWQF